MGSWFSSLSPAEQVKLAVQVGTWLVCSIFMLGVYAATVRFLTKRVGEISQTQKEHGQQLTQHEEMLGRLDERTAGLFHK